ncbi:hypothetical protein DLAC_10492 [Tieghemostelium lacteum]|uniref:Uncharacterized protein n=1 Tax=Tieghemostelium lacteum TaxID=361077 RepID=A0A151Z4P4_TIELA|nr:hypothetical protein DLAC_10492 [Tieghemostelium lacteum]|eukprot:KYQ88911.1 hypothetical protein DLAC_10492 [Tieghemostelium lacteum]
MIKIKKINEVHVAPIKLPKPPKHILGSDLFNQVSANILICAPKNSGKTVVVKKILDECAGKDTNVIIFCGTVNNDPSWLEIKKDLSKKKISLISFTSIFDDKLNLVEALIKALQQGNVKDNPSVDNKLEPLRKPGSQLILTNSDDLKKINGDNGIPVIEKKPKNVSPDYIIVFDDISNELKDKSIPKLMKIHRHFSSKIIISTQSWKDTSSSIRKGNLDYLLLFKNINEETLDTIHQELSITIPLRMFKEMYYHATSEIYHFFLIDRNGQFRKDFDSQYEIPE